MFREKILPATMWPVLLDMTEEESTQSLRHLELEAYSSLVSALRAQGYLSPNKRRILRETSLLLNISNDRHKAEVRRALSDEKLTTIAYHMTGQLHTYEDWAQEGRRLVPLLPRTHPQTPYSVIADEASEAALQSNKQLPHPANTERKRPLPQPPTATVVSTESGAKALPFRVPEVPKDESSKKRRYNSPGETSSLAQHLLSPKLTKIQQIYRQVSAKAAQSVEQAEKAPTPKINITQNVLIAPPVKQEPFRENQGPPAPKAEPEPPKIALAKKTLSRGQKLIVVPNNPSSILQKTLSVPINKLTKFNLDKFKIVPNSQLPSALQQKAITPTKPKLVRIKNASGKKVIPLSQLQMLNSKGSLKVVPYSGKMLEKNVPLASIQCKRVENEKAATPPVNNGTANEVQIERVATPIMNSEVREIEMEDACANDVRPVETNGLVVENGNNDFDFSIDHFRISGEQATSPVLIEDRNSNGESNGDEMDLDNGDLMEPFQGDEILEDFEVVHTEELLQHDMTTAQ